MVPKHLATTVLLAGGISAGCPSNDERPIQEETDEPASAVQTREGVEEMPRRVRDYSYAQKDQFVVDMNEELAAIQARLERLSNDVSTWRRDAKADAARNLESTHERWARAKLRLDAAKTADETTWDDVKSNFADAYESLEESVEDSRRWVSEEIAP